MQTLDGKKVHYAIRPDAQAFDKIVIETTPRYKESELSGDEWRISANVRFYRKGKIEYETGYRNVETALRHLAAAYDMAIDKGKGDFGGVDHVCDQEGCSEKATVFYKKKKDWCSSCGCSREIPHIDKNIIDVRKFCKRHSKRGDCGLDDADSNYELLEGIVQEPADIDRKQATFGGIASINIEGFNKL